MVFIFTSIMSIKNAKIAFKKVTSSPLPVFFTIVQPNVKTLLWNLVCVLFVCSFATYLPVLWITRNFLDLIGINFLEIEILILGIKIEKYQNPRNPFCSALNFTSFGVDGLPFTSNLPILCRSLQTFAPFFTQNRWTWCHRNALFFKNYERIFLEFWW